MNLDAVLKGLPPPEAWGSALATHGPTIAAWLLGLALAVQAGLVVTDLAGAKPVLPPTDAASPAPPGVQRLDLVTLVNAHLFGEAASTPVAGDAASAPQTTMALVLAGVLADEDPQRGIAILGETAQGAKVFSVGQSVPGGAKLHAVYGDRVILDRGGVLESLALPRQSGLAGATGAGRPPVAALAPLPAGAADAESPILDRMRRLIEEEPGIVGDVMRPQPVFAQGKQRGYRVYPGRNRAAFSRLGLRPGDLVTAINGTPLDDPARGGEIFRTLSSSADARVTVMRNGRQQELNLNLAQVAEQAEQLAAEDDGSPPPEPAIEVAPTPTNENGGPPGAAGAD
jgi:general secretion pathway protein C